MCLCSVNTRKNNQVTNVRIIKRLMPNVSSEKLRYVSERRRRSLRRLVPNECGAAMFVFLLVNKKR